MNANIHQDIDLEDFPLERMITYNNNDNASGEEAVVNTTPLVAIACMPSTSILRCYACGKYGNVGIKCCSGCRCAYFCNVTCQKQAWKHHKLECQNMVKNIKDKREKQQQQFQVATAFCARNSDAISNGEEGSAKMMEHQFTCSVCLDDHTKENHQTILLPCGHYFCQQCIRDVYYRGGDCPLCRQPVPQIDHLMEDRVKALLYLAGTQPDKEERHKICHLALNAVHFAMEEEEKGNYLLRELQGSVYYLMEDYDSAEEAYQKAYLLCLCMFRRCIHDPTANVREALRLLGAEEPSIADNFPQEVEEMEDELFPVVSALPIAAPTFSAILVGLARARMHSPPMN